MESHVAFTNFYNSLDIVAEVVYDNQVEKGFHDSHIIPSIVRGGEAEKELDQLEITKRLALCICEISEGIEAVRKNILVSEHIPEFCGLEEELADTVIRILDLSGQLKLRLAEAIKAKLSYNKTRGYKHGKNF